MTYGYFRYEGHFQVCFPQQSFGFTLARLRKFATAKNKSFGFQKPQNLVSRQAKAAISNETKNIQPSPDDEQPEPILFCSPHSSPTADEVSATVVINKSRKRKRQKL